MVNNTRRRRSAASNGRREEKPNVSEVTSEKEENDRLEVANVLSSLIFLPPKSDQNENSTENTEEKRQNPTSVNLTYLPNSQNLGIPVSPHHRAQGRQSKRGRGKSNSSASAHDKKTSELIAQLNSHLKNAVHSSLPQDQNRNEKRIVKDHAPLNVDNSGKTFKCQSPYSEASVSVNKSVASALRQAVSNNIKATQPASISKANDNVQIPANSRSDSVSAPTKVDSYDLEVSKKKETSDTNLPLKKRRLIGVDGESENLNSSVTLASIGSLTSWPKNLAELQQSAAHSGYYTKEHVHFQGKSAESGYRPVKFDPRTSLMVLQDVKVALTPDEDGDLPIHIAVVHENLMFVKKFIDIMAISGKTVDRYNKLQQTPLHLAILVKRPDIVEVLLKAGANPNLVDRNGCTSVHLSVCKQFPECLETILQCSVVPPSVNSRDYEGYYPLHSCVELNDFDAMKMLIKYEADMDVQDGKAGRSVLFYATEFNRTDMVRYLLEQGANAEIQNYAGISSLVIAQCNNNNDIINMLRQALDLAMYGDVCTEPVRKLQIPRLPDKPVAVLSEPEKIINLESNFSYRSYSRQSSVSSNSAPMDLSLPKNKESIKREYPEKGHKQKPKKKMKKDTKAIKLENVNGIMNALKRDRHASLIAALQTPTMQTYHAHMNKHERAYKDTDLDTNVNDAVADMETNHAYESKLKPKSLYLHKTSHDKNDAEMETEVAVQMINISRTNSVDSNNSNDREQNVGEIEKGIVSRVDFSAKGAEFHKNYQNATSVSEETTKMLDSQRQLLSQPVLLTRFSDLLKSISGPLKSEDIFEMIRPLIQFPLQNAVSRKSDLSSSEVKDKKDVKFEENNDNFVKPMEISEHSASRSQEIDRRFVHEANQSGLKNDNGREEACDMENESNLVIDEAEIDNNDKSCKGFLKKRRNKKKSVSRNDAQEVYSKDNTSEHIATNTSANGQGDTDVKTSAENSEELRTVKTDFISTPVENLNSKDSNSGKTGNRPTLPVESQALKSRTLFYNDGSGYKPIKIFIDDSEQSSLVLKKLLESCVVQPDSGASSFPAFSTQLNEANNVGNQCNAKSIQTQKPSSDNQFIPAGQIVIASDIVSGTDVSQVSVGQPSVQSIVSRTTDGVISESRVNSESPPLRPGLFALRKSYSVQKPRMDLEKKTIPSEAAKTVLMTQGLNEMIMDKSSLSNDCVSLSKGVLQSDVSSPASVDTSLVSNGVELNCSISKTSSIPTKTSFTETMPITSWTNYVGQATMSENAKDSMHSLNGNRFNPSKSVFMPSNVVNANLHSLTPVSSLVSSAIVTLPVTQNKSFQNVYMDSINASAEKSTSKPFVFTAVTPVNVLMQKSVESGVVNSLQSFSSTQAKEGVLKNQITLAPKPSAQNLSAKSEKPITDSVKIKQKSVPSGYPKKLEKTNSAEGTLTRVNPDVKNRLSKALQSPQRKQIGVSSPCGMTESDVNATKSAIPDTVLPKRGDNNGAFTMQGNQTIGKWDSNRTIAEEKNDESEVEMAVDNLKEQMESYSLSQGSEADEHNSYVSTANTTEDDNKDHEDINQQRMELEEERSDSISTENEETMENRVNPSQNTEDCPDSSVNENEKPDEKIKHYNKAIEETDLKSDYSVEINKGTGVKSEQGETSIEEIDVICKQKENCIEKTDITNEDSEKSIEENDVTSEHSEQCIKEINVTCEDIEKSNVETFVTNQQSEKSIAEACDTDNKSTSEVK
ncbi:hypothetical protein DPMN_076070 [Dreissena polymorpha]|uniref:Uncharacterized protein n=2 Tax=Dreissena polymorpha TaxID=45954 RepID=A0A9D4BNB0_DREPO|nr:hypothetical protein DPMN_076070 [Dreissena polymorpha]